MSKLMCLTEDVTAHLPAFNVTSHIKQSLYAEDCDGMQLKDQQKTFIH